MTLLIYLLGAGGYRRTLTLFLAQAGSCMHDGSNSRLPAEKTLPYRARRGRRLSNILSNSEASTVVGKVKCAVRCSRSCRGAKREGRRSGK